MRCLLVAMLLLAAGMIGAALSFAYFGWIGLLAFFLSIVACLLFAYRFGVRLAFWLTTRPLVRAGRTLRDAQVTIHSLQPSQPPDRGPGLDEIRRDPELIAKFRESYEMYASDLELHETVPTFDEWLEDEKREEAREDARHNWYDLDVTIAPSASQSHQPWQPGFLMLSAHDENLVEASFAGSFRDCGRVETIERWEEAERVFVPMESEDTCQGPTRLRLRLGLKRNLRRFKLNYHLTLVPGEIPVPER